MRPANPSTFPSHAAKPSSRCNMCDSRFTMLEDQNARSQRVETRKSSGIHATAEIGSSLGALAFLRGVVVLAIDFYTVYHY